MIFVANWKMNKGDRSAGQLSGDICQAVSDSSDIVILCPPFTSLASVSQSIQGTSVLLGAQNMHAEVSGAFTGEISAAMVVDLGCEYVILGHSERRQYFSESDAFINQKVKVALAQSLAPILCVGETLDVRESGETLSVIESQLRAGLDQVEDLVKVDQLLIAYEPVWAIGTGKVASSEQAQEVHAYIRSLLEALMPSIRVPILYGGSVKPDNATSLIVEKDIDGFLVGGASLNAEDFAKIVFCQK